MQNIILTNFDLKSHNKLYLQHLKAIIKIFKNNNNANNN